MSGGQIAALISAGAFVMLVLVLAVPILRLRRTVDAATRAINDITDRTGPLLGNVNSTVENVNTALTHNLVLARAETDRRFYEALQAHCRRLKPMMFPTSVPRH